MYVKQHRVTSVMAATLAALAFGAAPALAGEDDDGDDDEAPAQSAPVASGGSGSSSSAPQGGVATGAGGTASVPGGPEGLLLGLGTGALVLMATGGGLVAVSRRTGR